MQNDILEDNFSEDSNKDKIIGDNSIEKNEDLDEIEDLEDIENKSVVDTENEILKIERAEIAEKINLLRDRELDLFEDSYKEEMKIIKKECDLEMIFLNKKH